MFTMEVWFKAGGWSPNDIPCFSCLGNPAVYLLLGHRSISCSNWSPVISHLLAILTATSYFPCNGLKSPNIIRFLWSLVAASFTVWMQLEGSELQVTIHVTTWLNPAKWALLLAHNLAAFLHLLVECLLRAFQLSENTHTHKLCGVSWVFSSIPLLLRLCCLSQVRPNSKLQVGIFSSVLLMLQSDAPVDRFTNACNWTLAFMSYLYFTPMTATRTEENHYFKVEWKREKILKWLI